MSHIKYIVIFSILAGIYYGVTVFASRRIAKRRKEKHEDLKYRARRDLQAEAQWEKKIKKQWLAIFVRIGVRYLLIFFILGVLAVSSYKEVSAALVAYNESGDFTTILQNHFKALLLPLLTLFFLLFALKGLLERFR